MGGEDVVESGRFGLEHRQAIGCVGLDEKMLASIAQLERLVDAAAAHRCLAAWCERRSGSLANRGGDGFYHGTVGWMSMLSRACAASSAAAAASGLGARLKMKPR